MVLLNSDQLVGIRSIACSTCLSSSANDSDLAFGAAINKYEPLRVLGSAALSRSAMISRRRRLSRFRSTAFPTRRLIENATLNSGAPSAVLCCGGTNFTVSGPLRPTNLVRRSLLNEVRSLIPRIKPTICVAPSIDGNGLLPAQLSCSYDDENRDDGPVAWFSADRCVSLVPPGPSVPVTFGSDVTRLSQSIGRRDLVAQS